MADEIIIRFTSAVACAVYDDAFPFRELGFSPPTRASNVEPIQAGPYAGFWYVDMSPLGGKFRYCLWPPYPKRDAALADEKKHVIEVYVREKPCS